MWVKILGAIFIFFIIEKKKDKSITARKLSKYRVISGPYFPVFRLNTEIYFSVVLKSPY